QPRTPLPHPLRTPPLHHGPGLWDDVGRFIAITRYHSRSSMVPPTRPTWWGFHPRETVMPRVRNLLCTMGAALVVITVVTATFAQQQQGQGGPPGGRGGRGGFGGGPGGFGGPGGPGGFFGGGPGGRGGFGGVFGLLQNEAVQEDLKLTAKQKDQVK